MVRMRAIPRRPGHWTGSRTPAGIESGTASATGPLTPTGDMPLLAELDTTTLRRTIMAEKGAMTVREAGRKGGTQTKRRHGPDFYTRIGRKGGETTKQRHGPDFYEKIGRKGGQRMRQLVAAAKAAEKRRR
jgi:uncharacterized protein